MRVRAVCELILHPVTFGVPDIEARHRQVSPAGITSSPVMAAFNMLIQFASPESDGQRFCPARAAAHLNESVEAYKRYVHQHIAQLADGSYAVWLGGRSFKTLQPSTIQTAYLKHKETREQAVARGHFNNETYKPSPFSSWAWFKDEVVPLLEPTLKPRAPLVFFDDEAQCHRINEFPGLPFEDDTRKLADFSEETRSQIGTILAHLHDIICTNNEHQYTALLQWLAFTIEAQQTHVALFLSSTAGTGKSSFFQDFFGKRIIATKKTYFGTNSPELVVGTHNAELYGKTYLLLDDIKRPAGGFESLYAGLKALITSKEFSCRRMGVSAFLAPLMANIIIISNHLGDMALSDDDRRVMCLDCSGEKKGDTRYFDRLHAALGAEETPAAFCAYLRGIYNPTFCFTNLPASENRRAGIIANLSPTIRFLRERYVVPWTKRANALPIETLACVPYSDLNTEYQRWCADNNRPKVSDRELSTQMSQKLNYKPTKSVRILGTICKCYAIDKYELLATFRANNWIDELDGEIYTPGCDNNAPLPPIPVKGRGPRELTVADLYDDLPECTVQPAAAAVDMTSGDSGHSSATDGLDELGLLG